jgi:hypothetical protein
MSKPSHTTNGEYINPEVRFERVDIAPGTVLKFGIGLAVLIAASSCLTWWMFNMILRQESKVKKTDLPPAAVDSRWTDRQPPEPRLEAFNDLFDRNVKLMPPRARESLAAQEKLLAEGDRDNGILSINEAIEQIKLPSRKGPDSAAPASFSRRLPSKASAGRRTTGGE